MNTWIGRRNVIAAITAASSPHRGPCRGPPLGELLVRRVDRAEPRATPSSVARCAQARLSHEPGTSPFGRLPAVEPETHGPRLLLEHEEPSVVARAVAAGHLLGEGVEAVEVDAASERPDEGRELGRRALDGHPLAVCVDHGRDRVDAHVGELADQVGLDQHDEPGAPSREAAHRRTPCRAARRHPRRRSGGRRRARRIDGVEEPLEPRLAKRRRVLAPAQLAAHLVVEPDEERLDVRRVDLEQRACCWAWSRRLGRGSRPTGRAPARTSGR